MKKSSLLIILAIAIIASLTNPNEDRHKEVLKTKLKTQLQKATSLETEDVWEEAGQALGTLIGGGIINLLVDNMISTDNYILFSTTKMSYDGESKVIGIGAFGNVLITGDLQQLLNESS